MSHKTDVFYVSAVHPVIIKQTYTRKKTCGLQIHLPTNANTLDTLLYCQLAFGGSRTKALIGVKRKKGKQFLYRPRQVPTVPRG
jgi:hypothetical protein